MSNTLHSTLHIYFISTYLLHIYISTAYLHIYTTYLLHIYISTQCPALGDFISCFADVAGLEETRCRFSEGHRTCFTSYDAGEDPARWHQNMTHDPLQEAA